MFHRFMRSSTPPIHLTLTDNLSRQSVRKAEAADVGSGHASITTTAIYSHLRHDLFAEKAFDAVTVDLARPAGDVVSISRSSGPLGHTIGTAQEDNEERKLA